MTGYIVENLEGEFGEALIYKRRLSKKKELELEKWFFEKYNGASGCSMRLMTKAEVEDIVKFGKALFETVKSGTGGDYINYICSERKYTGCK